MPSSAGVGMSDRAFADLQEALRTFWPQVTLRSIGDIERAVVVVHSRPPEIPATLAPVFPAYEERFLCLVLSLLRAPRSRVVYVTSQPIHPRVLHRLSAPVPELDTAEARSRFASLSLVDGRNEPLAKKLLARPGAIRRIRELVGEPELAIVIPFAMTEHEVELAVRLGIPIYGCDPALSWLGTKTGSRSVFADEDVPHPAGLEVREPRGPRRGAPRAAQAPCGRAERRSSSTRASAASGTRSSTSPPRTTCTPRSSSKTPDPALDEYLAAPDE